jgi:hypothetical protein
MLNDDTLDEVLKSFAAQNAETLSVFAEVDLDTTMSLPPIYTPLLSDSVTVRWAALHIIEELARHAGHADIIRESIDGATMYELIMAQGDRQAPR